ncbi:MAG: hypothetical protein WC437_00250 [Patescibacteria group bacterium]
MEPNFNFTGETTEEITEKVAAVMQGIYKASDSGFSKSIQEKGAMQPTANYLIELAKLGLTIEEVEVILDASKCAVKQQTVFGNKRQ